MVEKSKWAEAFGVTSDLFATNFDKVLKIFESKCGCQFSKENAPMFLAFIKKDIDPKILDFILFRGFMEVIDSFDGFIQYIEKECRGNDLFRN